MKRISIKLRVTLWFTLLMLVLGGLALGLLFYGGAQSGLAARRELLTTMVEDSEKQIDLDGTALEIDRDLEHSGTGSTCRSTTPPAFLFMGWYPVHLTTPPHLETVSCAPSREKRPIGTSTISGSRSRAGGILGAGRLRGRRCGQHHLPSFAARGDGSALLSAARGA